MVGRAAASTPFHVLDKATIELGVKMCINPEGTAKLPKMVVNIHLEDVALKLSDAQIGHLLHYADTIGKEVASMGGAHKSATSKPQECVLIALIWVHPPLPRL
jgi:hypothetical protein